MQIIYRVDETEDLIRADRLAAEHLHNFLLTMPPRIVGESLYNQTEERLAVLYGRIEPYQPFGPY
jgi:hypothetical protein